MSMSRAAIQTFEIGLTALSALLDKGQAYAEAKRFDPAVLLNSRLFPDMFPLSRQVQIGGKEAVRRVRHGGRGGKPRSIIENYMNDDKNMALTSLSCFGW